MSESARKTRRPRSCQALVTTARVSKSQCWCTQHHSNPGALQKLHPHTGNFWSLANFCCAVDVLDREDGAQSEQEDLGERCHELRLRHNHVDAVRTRVQDVQALQCHAVPALEDKSGTFQVMHHDPCRRSCQKGVPRWINSACSATSPSQSHAMPQALSLATKQFAVAWISVYLWSHVAQPSHLGEGREKTCFNLRLC